MGNTAALWWTVLISLLDETPSGLLKQLYVQISAKTGRSMLLKRTILLGISSGKIVVAQPTDRECVMNTCMNWVAYILLYHVTSTSNYIGKESKPWVLYRFYWNKKSLKVPITIFNIFTSFNMTNAYAKLKKWNQILRSQLKVPLSDRLLLIKILY